MMLAGWDDISSRHAKSCLATQVVRLEARALTLELHACAGVSRLSSSWDNIMGYLTTPFDATQPCPKGNLNQPGPAWGSIEGGG